MLALSTFGMAQRNGLFSETLTATGAGSQPINALGSTTFVLQYGTTGVPATLSIQIESSTDGTTFVICGSAVTTVTANTTTCTGNFQKVRANLTALTGGTAPTVTYVLQALTSQLSSTGVIVNGISLADSDGKANNPTADTVGNLGPNGPLRVVPSVYNGTTWDRFRSSSLANYPTSATTTARNIIGAQITEKGSRWVINSAPAAGTQATASIPAEAAVRHVLDSVCLSSGSAVAPALTSLQINIRDGATGAGTILASFEIDISAVTGQNTPPVCISGLNIVGTTNTAMTVEWSAGLANLKETASAIGFNVN